MFTLNVHKFLHTMYKCVLNSVAKISMMFAKYFEYYTIILRGPFFRGHAVERDLYRKKTASTGSQTHVHFHVE